MIVNVISDEVMKNDTVVDDGVGECDAAGRRLGAVRDGGHGEGGLVEEAVAGEERAGVAVGAHAQQEDVEPGQPGFAAM